MRSMSDYVTEYPSMIKLRDDNVSYTLTVEDNQNRVLITETDLSLDRLRTIFGQEGFSNTMVEEKKPSQIGQGVLKHLTQEWDMHVRFLRIHQDLIAIDGEVETSREFLEHATEPIWVSVIYEIAEILRKYGVQFIIWHKKLGRYVEQVIQKIQLTMKPNGKIRWKPIVAAAAIISSIALLVWAISKARDEK